MDVNCSFISSVAVIPLRQEIVVAVGVPGGSLGAGGMGNSLLFIKERAFSVLVFCYDL